MSKDKIQGLLLDVDYITQDEKSCIRLFIKTDKGIETFFDKNFYPYFYTRILDENTAEQIRDYEFSEGVKVKSVKTKHAGMLKVEFENVPNLLVARKEITALPEVAEIFEFDVPFAKRYLIDKQLEPMAGIKLTIDGNEVLETRIVEEKVEPTYAAFDIETLSPGRFSNPEKDPVLMISFYTKGKGTVLTTHKKLDGKKGIQVFGTEKEMIQGFLGLVEKEKIDVLVTYNGDNFDLPYLKDRAKTLGFKLAFYPTKEEPSVKKLGRDNAVRLHGVQHFDAYQLLRFLSRFGVVNLVKFGLEAVALSLFGEEKEKIDATEINEIWETGKGLEKLAQYCNEDSEIAHRIAVQYAPLVVELGKLVKITMFDANRASASQLIEQLLMNKAFVEGKSVPNKPTDQETHQRLMQTYKGGFVKEPVPGLHERLAVLDFSSLHPSIMISHNVSPETIDCGHKDCEANKAPNNHYFCQKEEGFLSGILKELFEKRMGMKKLLKEIKKDAPERLLMDARQHALKILMNSFYGYLGYARSRWFSRECAAAVTAWSRQYVNLVLDKAEKNGFEPLYGDTDSAFLIMPQGKEKEDVKKFVSEINADLPGVMNLELEGFFKRGIFVTKETGEGAKKKYALIDYDHNLKIVGFEYVRRDWSKIAKDTQREVIRAVLEKGKPDEAAQIIMNAIEKLRSGKAEKQELVVLTQLKRALEKYESIGPHVSAARKAVAKGKDIEVGSVLSYIITRSGRTISDKAELEEYVAEGNYDADYYIENQVVPAVIKIMRELGYSKEDLLHGGKQSKLGAFG
ncbi:MAG: DNA polymerase [Candidatus Diapherotrites archaeon]|uniref:DNA-directed DNA polymerase n=1 Tax=Candidatus Iainarchaeum sp. TaxID=3101447 RepID=A0A2D6M0V9_9ARCH|nr:DNA polymerase [Candidatus Diapherotrites archaeon]|tara:strand:- start:6369 stop:8756 length:2388 start_codon:yes stop_codon:yes gene_type:complete